MRCLIGQLFLCTFEIIANTHEGLENDRTRDTSYCHAMRTLETIDHVLPPPDDQLLAALVQTRNAFPSENTGSATFPRSLCLCMASETSQSLGVNYILVRHHGRSPTILRRSER